MGEELDLVTNAQYSLEKGGNENRFWLLKAKIKGWIGYSQTLYSLNPVGAKKVKCSGLPLDMVYNHL